MSRLRENPDKLFEVFIEVGKPTAHKSEPFILQKYPLDFNDEEVLKSVPKFAFPCDTERYTTTVDHFTFTLTDLDSKFRFGFCRHATGAQTCLCIVSFLPWFEVFYNLLNILAEITNRTDDNDVTAMLRAAYVQEVPGSGLPVTIVFGQEMMSFKAPEINKLPSIPASRNLLEYYNAVDTENMMTIFASMLHERRIIVTSKKLSRLTAVVYASSNLLYPMYWQHLFIPVLPEFLKDYLSATMPFVIGVHVTLMEKVNKMELGDAVIVDADNNKVTTQYDDLVDLPEEVSHYLKKYLKGEKLSASMQGAGDAISKTFMMSLVKLLGGYRDALKFTEGETIKFSPYAFVQSRPLSMQPFLQNMLHLQIFQQFIIDRLDMLNCGAGFADLFEQECLVHADKLNSQTRYNEWLGKMKKQGKKLEKGGKDVWLDFNVKAKPVRKEARGVMDIVTNQKTEERCEGNTDPSRRSLRKKHNFFKFPSDKASRPMVTPAPQPKPKEPHPTVQPAQPAQPAMSKPGPPKLPDTGPVISAEQDKQEPEKEERQPTVPSKKPIFPSPPLTKKPTKSIDLKDIENMDDGKHGRLLEQDEKLLGICTSFGRKSQQLKDECEIICKRVRKITEVLNVYAAFQETDESIVIFIVSVKAVSDEISKNLTDLGIRFIVKQLDFNNSLISNTKLSVAFQIKDSEVELIRTCISNNADRLMAKHKYLSIVEGCYHKRECGVAIDSSACKYEPRLALYVLAKGYIPIDEDPFEKSYDGIQVEVREGVFVPFVKTSNEYHDHVRMGCAIQRCLKGTLGLFIEHNIYGLCGLTCAHVMLSKEEHERCKQINGRIHPDLLLNDCEVYQPEHPHGLGSLVEAIYKEGNCFQTGIDIALVEIKQRHPIDGKFPSSKDGINSESTEITFEFASGKALTPNLNNGRCCKFGQMSGYTEGTLINKEQNSVARDVLEVLGYKFVIYNQLNVKSSTDLFAKPGDSGSPVFVKDGDGEPACIGIVVGGRTCDGVVYVTPINTILQELGISQLKSFIANRFERLEAKVNSIDQKLDFLITKLTSSTGTQ